MLSANEDMLMTFQVSKLVTKYNMSWDEGRFGDVGSCFTDDGVFVDATGTAHEGCAAIETFGEKSRELFGAMRHITANHVVAERPSGWSHRCYITFVSGIGRHDKTVATGYYDDEFVVTSDGPRFTIRRVYLDA